MLTLRSLPGAFRVPGFGLLWVSLASIGLGTAISQVALTWTMLELTGSPMDWSTSTRRTVTVRVAGTAGRPRVGFVVVR